MDALLGLAFLALAVAAPFLYPRFSLRRALSRPLPPAALDALRHYVPIHDRLGPELQQQLHRLVKRFLHEKKFVGCAGLEVTDAMRVAIAGQACLLLLNRPMGVYPTLRTILLYPGAFAAARQDVGPGGVITHFRQTMLGESWEDGRVVLSWDDTERGALAWDGHNVVLHEFAHQLDSESGQTNGAPYLGSRENYRNWSEVLSRDYAHLQRAAWLGNGDTVLDHYGATSPAEFFAVATEAFFGKPWQLASRHPALYDELSKYYRVDPRQWLDEPPAESGPEPVVAMPAVPSTRSFAWASW
ncbi:M90 family metallopeptidase [Massilia sp. METH4]|uniref:M90 family metallopeptidase n=1 Tax=Massilia sp. METH4 TaxID=3123041 RepID=UPI0030D12D08